MSGSLNSDISAFCSPLPQAANRRERLRFEKEGQRRECTPIYKMSWSKRYKACSNEVEAREVKHRQAMYRGE